MKKQKNKQWTLNKLRKSYLEYFSATERKHAVIPSASLVPENDPTTLFTGSGMQPLIPYLLGAKHPKGIKLVDSQKCFRSEDIEEVGDNRHTTFFEMLGNWSLGDYFKAEQLKWIFDFLINVVGLNPKKIYVSVFGGDKKFNFNPDNEAVKIWNDLFAEKQIEAKDVFDAEKKGMQGGRIFYYPAKKNWWSRAGVPENMPVGEPGGGDSEIFYDFGEELKLHENSRFKNDLCHPNCDCGRFLEIGNSVFMEFVRTKDGFETLKNKNIDFGGGLERILAASYNEVDLFKTDAFSSIITEIEKATGKFYKDSENKPAMRVIADHIRSAVMLIGDSVVPSNKEQGYFLRRLIRRAVVKMAKLVDGDNNSVKKAFIKISNKIVRQFDGIYFDYEKDCKKISSIISDEIDKFNQSLDRGLREFNKLKEINGKLAFNLFQTYGFPLEMTLELAEGEGIKLVNGKEVLIKEYKKARKAHADHSRQQSSDKFKGGLQDQSETTTKYHTATHLFHQALREVLGDHVVQKGSNITGQRLRFDFSHPNALTDDEKKQVIEKVNKWIKEDLLVIKHTMNKGKALKSGALAFFAERYPDEVTVYKIGDKKKPISFELCGGPHVESTGKIGQLEIFKEKSASAGVRRIYVRLL